MGSRVETRMVDGAAVITLADGARRNVIDAESSAQLGDAVESAVAGGAGAIVLTAEPPVFCAGGSLDDLCDLEVSLAPFYRGFLALSGAPVPTIAAVDGACIGAGINLPLCCDVTLVTPRARFDSRFLDVGIHPGGGHVWRLARRIGAQGAAALVLFGDRLDGPAAADCGLAWRCVESAELMPLALDLARRSAGRSPALVARAKQTWRAAIGSQSEEDAVAGEAQAQEWSRLQPGFADRVRALKEGLR